MDSKKKVPEAQARLDLDQIALEATALGETEVPARVLIAPWGEVETTAGSFVVDEEAAQTTIAAFEKHGTDLPVDYEHQTLGGPFSSPTGRAPAAGWIKALTTVSPSAAGGGDAETPGLWAAVEWTDEAKEQLRSRQYRYLSPVALVRRADRRMVGLHSVALTNKPAIVGMQPVVNRDAAAPAEPVVSPASRTLRGILAVDEAADEEVVLLAAADRIQTLEQAQTLREASERVAAALSSGKLTAAQRDWALSLAQRDPAEFDRWTRSAPVIVPLGRLTPPPTAETASSERRRAADLVARAEWRANRDFLEKICTEAAYVAGALRDIERE